MGDDFIDILVKESNRYYHQNNSNNNRNKNKEWIVISNIEMKKFVGFIILIRSVRKSKKKMNIGLLIYYFILYFWKYND